MWRAFGKGVSKFREKYYSGHDFKGGVVHAKAQDKLGEYTMLTEKKIFSINELTEYIKILLEGNPVLREITVRGEISNYYVHSSGHLYFTLKDRAAQIKCVMFRSAARLMKFQLEAGMNVIASGSVSIYQDRGEYQLYIQEIEPDGIGALHLAFEQLKKKLAQEGLFDAERKKPIPRLPRRIGVVTSPTGAAIRDIISIIRRRFPYVEILLSPAIVQGAEAPQSLARALGLLQDEPVDVIIMGRGGGSMEDLWAFNEEVVARAIYASRIPVISAVGHETDFTIADFVADLRAATPSAAAELAVANFNELSKYLASVERRLQQSMVSRVEKYSEKINRLQNRRIFIKPEDVFLKPWQRVDELERRLNRTMEQYLRAGEEKLRAEVKHLESLSPLNVLSRGYSLTQKTDGGLVQSVNDAKSGDEVLIRLQDGTLKAVVQ